METAATAVPPRRTSTTSGPSSAAAVQLAASQELRKMLNIGRTDEANSVTHLSDAELIAQLSDMAKQLGVNIKMDYSFI
jgi:hypothetical protein